MSVEALVNALNLKTEEAMASGKPLAERLRMVADEVRAQSPLFADAVDGFVGRLTGAEAGAQSPGVGEQFPNFFLPDQKGRMHALANMLAEGPVIVAFLRGHWCPYCRITASALSEIAERAEKQGARIVAITPESRKYAAKLDADSGGAYPILADLDNGFALSVNLAIWVDEQMASLIAGAGWDIPTYQGNDAWVLPIPAVFALDRAGQVVARHVNPDYRERADIDAILDSLAALS